MYDLVIRGGRLIDPASGLDGCFDIAVVGERIARIDRSIHADEVGRLIDITGKLVLPGLVDLHAHVYWGVSTDGVSSIHAPADLVGVRSGVTTLVDAGSAGFHNLGGFVRYVVPSARTRLFAFLNVCRDGLFANTKARPGECIDLASTIRVIEAHRTLVQGVKLILTGAILDELGLEAVRLASRAARESGTRLMVHIGDLRAKPNPTAAQVTREMLRMLAPGDIVTHACTAHSGGLLDVHGQVIPEAVDAKSRGVILDSAHGRTNLSFAVARRLIDQGLVPDVISSDMTLGGRLRIVHSLLECASKFMALGLGIGQVISMVTANPARALGLSETLGAIAPGREADLTILDVVEGDWEFADSFGATLRAEKALVPVATVRAGEVITPDWGPHPRGWLPTRSVH